MKTLDELTDEMLNILERFDFQKVHAYMVLKDWKIYGEIQTPDRIRGLAREMFNHLIPKYLLDGNHHIMSNEDFGLIITVGREGTLSLYFFIEQKDSYPL